MTTDSAKHLEAVEAIKKKLVGKTLTYKEIFNLMDEIAHNRLGDVLTAYFVASGFKAGFTSAELYFLTKSVVETGTQLHFDGIVADKHSIGGLAGARTTLIAVPIIAAAGFKIPKTSSRAITTPAGTADSMELFAPVTLTPQQMEKIVNEVGGCIVWGGHLGIAPADDVIIRVQEPLAFESFDKVIISIMAKKIAVGANHLVLDIPVGRTMKVNHMKDAEAIAKKFMEIGERFNMKIVTDIHPTVQPAGDGVGPYLEAMDALKVLEQRDDRPIDLEKRAIRLARQVLDLCYKTAKIEKDGLTEARKLLKDGSALKKFKEIVQAQGGDPDFTNSKKLKTFATKKEILSTQSGTITDINNHHLSSIAKVLESNMCLGINILLQQSD